MNNMTQLQFKDGDDGDDTNETYNTIISSCDNGFIVTVQSDDGDYTTVYNYEDGNKMIEYIREALGVK